MSVTTFDFTRKICLEDLYIVGEDFLFGFLARERVITRARESSRLVGELRFLVKPGKN